MVADSCDPGAQGGDRVTEFKASLGYRYSASKTEQKEKSYMSVIAAFGLKNRGLREGLFLCIGVM